MLVDYLEEKNIGRRPNAWTPVSVEFDEDRLPSPAPDLDEYRLSLTVFVDYTRARDFGWEARRAAERKLMAYLYKDARARIEAIESAIHSFDKRAALEACAMMRKELGE